MSNSNWQKTKEIFDEALEQPVEQRSQFLLEKCGSDDKTREEVESLLRNYQVTFLEKSPKTKILELITDDRLAAEQKIDGRYLILKKLGEGGMGEVYLAEDLKFNRQVALKVLNEELSQDKRWLKDFESEAKKAASIDSENIITIFESGMSDGISYITSEFFEGITLREKLKTSKLKIQETLNIISKVSSALEKVHQKNIVHSDIKPENIMINNEGKIKVLDFGIAKLNEPNLADFVSGQNPFTQAETIRGFGTINYMSPEQARGEKIDGRSDIWSLGVCLYEMLTGKQPFADKTYDDTKATILKLQPAPIKDIQIELERIVEKCLQKDSKDRYQTIGDFRAAFEKVINGKAENSENLNNGMNPFKEWRKTSGRPIRNRLFLCVILCCVISLIFAAISSKLLNTPPSDSADPEIIDAKEKRTKRAKRILEESGKSNPSNIEINDIVERSLVVERIKAKRILEKSGKKEPLETEINDTANNLANENVAKEIRIKTFAENFKASVGFFHLILLAFAFHYYFKNPGLTEFHDIEKDKEEDGRLKSSITYSTGYEDPSDWKTARDNATDALNNFKGKFFRLLMAWSFFYLIIVLGFITEEKWSDLFKDHEKEILPLITSLLVSLLTLVNNFNTIYLWSCYEILNNPISLESKISETRKVIIKQNNQGHQSLDSFYVVGFIWFLFELILPILSPQNGEFFHDASYLLSGLFGGIAMAVFVGRFQSKFLKSSKVLIILLYLYTVIQSLFIFIGDDSTKSKMLGAVVIQIALFLKGLLILYIFWLFQSGRLLYYLVRVKRADEQMDSQWKNFPEVLKKGSNNWFFNNSM